MANKIRWNKRVKKHEIKMEKRARKVTIGVLLLMVFAFIGAYRFFYH